MTSQRNRSITQLAGSHVTERSTSPSTRISNGTRRRRRPLPRLRRIGSYELVAQARALQCRYGRALRSQATKPVGYRTSCSRSRPPEQRRIVEAIESYLSRLDDAVASLERVQRNLKRYRASVLKAAVEGRLVPTEAELARAEGRGLRAGVGAAGAHPRRTPAAVGGSRAGEDEGQGQGAEGRQVEGEVQEPVAPEYGDLPSCRRGGAWAMPSINSLLGGHRAAQFRTGRYAQPYYEWRTNVRLGGPSQ